MPVEDKGLKGDKAAGDGNGDPPEWMKRWEGKSLDDVAKAHYELEQQHGKQGQEVGTLRERAKLADKIEALGGMEAVEYWAKYGAQAWQKEEESKKRGAGQSVAPGTGEAGGFDPAAWESQFENWETYDPKTQALRLFKGVWDLNQRWLKENVLGFLTEKEQHYGKQIQEALGLTRREWDLYRKALGLHLKNPKIDVEDLLKRTRDLATSDADKLFELVAGQITGPEETELRIKAEVEKALAADRATREQEDRNRQVNVLSRGARPGASLPETPKTPAEENAAILKMVGTRR